MRTWEENKRSINGLWPQCQWSDEERSLWHDDLSVLDQATLYEALRNVKRNHDSLYPQLKWIREEYRTLKAAKAATERAAKPVEPAFTGDALVIDIEESRRLAAEIAMEIESSDASGVDAIQAKIKANINRIDAVVASRLSWRAGALLRKKDCGDEHSAVRFAPQAVAGVVRDEDFEEHRARQLRILREVKS